MITKFHVLQVKEKTQGRMYLKRVHQYGCAHCSNATSGYIGQVEKLALPYSVHEQEVHNGSIKELAEG